MKAMMSLALILFSSAALAQPFSAPNEGPQNDFQPSDFEIQCANVKYVIETLKPMCEAEARATDADQQERKTGPVCQELMDRYSELANLDCDRQ